MATERSLRAYDAQHKATDTFDYFVCGVAGAIFAYIVKDYDPRTIAWDFSILTPASLLLLALSFFSGLKRLETTLNCARLNAIMLDSAEKAGHLTETLSKGLPGPYYNKLSGEIDTVATIAERRESYMREALGFSATLAAKVAQPYGTAKSGSAINTNWLPMRLHLVEP